MAYIWSAIMSLVLLGIALPPAADAQQTKAKPEAPRATAQEKLKLEVDRLHKEIGKLEAETANLKNSERQAAEIAKLQAEAKSLPPWYLSSVSVLVGFFGAALTGWFGLRSALKERVGTFDMKLYEERSKAYGSMITATRAFAIHFPERFVDRDVCAETGRLLRAQFFAPTGWLLTVDARRRYMTLLHALTRAAHAERLNVPSSDDHYAMWISEPQLDEYRSILRLTPKKRRVLGFSFTLDVRTARRRAKDEMKRCTEHQFGKAQNEQLPGKLANEKPDVRNRAAAELFRDYVVLQFASSRLRTQLGRDVSARRPLAELPRTRA
jgi:hypothetical protein